MAIQVTDLKKGDVIYDCHRQKAGNTAMSVDGLFGGGRSCHMCGAKESTGHHDDCDHPRAVAARKREAKARRKADNDTLLAARKAAVDGEPT